MAVTQMERVRLLAMKRDRRDILELLQHRGTVEVESRPATDEAFGTEDTSASRALLEKNAETAAHALDVLAEIAREKKPFLSFLSGRKAVEPQVNDAFVKVRETVLRVAQRVVQLQRERAECKAEMLRLDGQIEALTPWLDLPVPQIFDGTRRTAMFVGSVEGAWTLDALLARLAAAASGLDKLHAEIVHASREQTCLYLICLKEDAALAEEALRSLGFARPAAASSQKPIDKKAELERQREEARGRIEAANAELAGYTDRMDDIRYLQDHMAMRAEKYEVIQRLAHTRHVFVLQGYVPRQCAPALREELERRFECSVETQAAPQADETPVRLQNPGFARPAETVLESYSLPGKGDIDPTPVMSIFYYFMFGLMFSDAGYGLIMALVCGILLLRKRNMEDNWKKNIGLFFWCGVSTVFWGIMFGSYFGDAIAVVSGNFFGTPLLIKPLWLDPLKNPMSLLMSCLGLGILHMTFGMVLKAVTLAKSRQFADILYDAVFPVCIIYPLIIILMGSEMFAGMAGFSLALPGFASTLCLAVAAVGALGVILFGGRESRNWFKRLLKGAYALYNVIAGWLGDILSYSRLLALGLATGVIATVINSMGAMVGGGVVGVIAFVLIFLVGQALNFGINVLGAYVHSNRLEFVEFFGKFYEGGGRKFAPFGMHTKYYKIQEETNNVDRC